VVEITAFETRQTLTGLGGSNPPTSATKQIMDINSPPNPNQPPSKEDAGKRKIEEVITEVARQGEESREAYLVRADKIIMSLIKEQSGQGLLFRPSKTSEGNLSLEVNMLIKKATTEMMRESVSVVDQKKNAYTLELITEEIGAHEHITKPDDSESYDKTERNRKFFEEGAQKGGETYWNTLFLSFNTRDTREMAQEILKDKTIVLLGGGRARLKEEMLANGISPKEVLNIDPFVSDVEPGADEVIPVSATDEGLPKILAGRGIEKVDEIWAEYSVPAYLDNPTDIKQLFKNIDQLLADNGSARIWPTMIRGGTEAEVNIRKVTLMEALNELSVSGKYEIVKFDRSGRPGFTLHKIRNKE
jgi:hypothetical protein